MSTFNIKNDPYWRRMLLRIVLVIASVGLIVWSMPRDSRTYFHVEQGKPWKYAEFTAPYDFPIYKSEATIKAERDSIMREYEPYYKYKKDVEEQMVHKFMYDYAQGIPGLPADYLFVISNRLHSLYDQGIMEQKEYNELRNDTSKTIRVVNDKQAASVSIQEVYSPKSAYEQLFLDPKLSPQRSILKRCNLND